MADSRAVSCVQPFSLELEADSTGWSPYEGGGIAAQHKQGKQLAFRSLDAALRLPGDFLLSDFAKLDRSALLHVGFQALDQFQGPPHRELVTSSNLCRLCALLTHWGHISVAPPLHQACCWTVSIVKDMPGRPRCAAPSHPLGDCC